MKGYSTPRLLLFALAALLAELVVLPGVGPRETRPDLLVPVVGFAALFALEPRQALFSAWTVGLLRDALTVGPPGLYSLVYLALAWGLSAARQVLFRDHPLTQLVVAAVGSAGTCLVTATAASFHAGALPLRTWFVTTFFSALLTALAAPPVMALLIRVRTLVR